jgi:hypothetical protein
MSIPEMLHSEKPVGGPDRPSSLPIALKASSLPLPTRIAFVGNYLPRQCGIATFTTDLCTALAVEYGKGQTVCYSRQRSRIELRISRASAFGNYTRGSLPPMNELPNFLTSMAMI